MFMNSSLDLQTVSIDNDELYPYQITVLNLIVLLKALFYVGHLHLINKKKC